MRMKLLRVPVNMWRNKHISSAKCTIHVLDTNYNNLCPIPGVIVEKSNDNLLHLNTL